jgi:hypothetical protein
VTVVLKAFCPRTPPAWKREDEAVTLPLASQPVTVPKLNPTMPAAMLVRSPTAKEETLPLMVQFLTVPEFLPAMPAAAKREGKEGSEQEEEMLPLEVQPVTVPPTLSPTMPPT